ncbi:hypothetical protein Fmac_021649 [Flemingia macrophylla]|uniref:Uncharacterized protein n=1 Tax=Flemingia macrophylla TaxID=520843 RepID=A0ABD1LXG6_9FABA
MFSQDHDESRDLPPRISEERKNKLRIFGFGIPDLDIGCWHTPRRLMEFSFEELEGLREELTSLIMEKITFHAETVSQDGVAVLDFHCSNVEYLIKEAERFYEAEFARVLCEAVAVTLGEKWARLGEEQARLEELERYFENQAKDCEAMKDIKIQIFESNTHEVDYFGLSHAIRCLCPSKDTRSESKIVAWWNQWKTMFSPDHDESHDYIKAVFDSSGKMTYQLCDPTMYDGENFIVGKCKKTLQRVSSLLIAAIAFLWIISDICSQLSIFQLEQRRILSSLFKLFGFTVFVCAVTTMVVVGAPFSRLQRTMLMFWAIMMLARSAMSLTALYVSMLGILLMGRHVLFEKQPPHGG